MVFSVSVLIIEAISPYGYTDQQAGICASIIVFSGIFGGGKKEIDTRKSNILWAAF